MGGEGPGQGGGQRRRRWAQRPAPQRHHRWRSVRQPPPRPEAQGDRDVTRPCGGCILVLVISNIEVVDLDDKDCLPLWLSLDKPTQLKSTSKSVPTRRASLAFRLGKRPGLPMPSRPQVTTLCRMVALDGLDEEGGGRGKVPVGRQESGPGEGEEEGGGVGLSG